LPIRAKNADAAIDEFREHVKVGVLMSYGISLVEASPVSRPRWRTFSKAPALPICRSKDSISRNS